MFDYLIVGAGFAGSVLAERLASQAGKKILIVDIRPHIGGNAYDHYDDSGILVHKYGPHIFHTNSRQVFEYLSQFTEWRPYEHRVLASVDGQLVPIPINLDTINKLYGLKLDVFQVQQFYESIAEPRDPIRTSEDVVVSKVGQELYEKFFRGYTRKQWGIDPSELDRSVTARVPTRTNRDDRYFTDSYQAMPLHGYTRMFEQMLSHPNIKVMLNTDYREIAKVIPYREMIYTGPVDAFFDYCYGKLPYRSLEFKHETLGKPVYQPAPVVNYPNEHLYTRITEFKYLTGQEHPKTSIVYEYPQDEGDPYYPVPKPENAERYKQYKALADATPNVHFVGRLATYKYYNMDQVVAQALTVFNTLQERGEGTEPEQRELITIPSQIGFEQPNFQSPENMMNIVSAIKIPCSLDTADLYLRCSANVDLANSIEKQEIKLRQGDEVSFNSYFNSFYESFYDKYVQLSDLYYLLKLQGSFKISLYREVHEGNDRQLILQQEFHDCQLEHPVKLALPSSQAERKGRIYLEMTCLSSEGLFQEGLVVTEQSKKQEVSLAIISCTFKKETYIKNTVNEILQDKFLQDKPFKIFVVDNAQTLQKDDFADERVQLIPNRNLGGSGGFTRGLVEALQEDGYTHFLFMDDDIELDSEVIHKLFSLYEYAESDFAVAGSMLDLHKKSVVWEAGAVYARSLSESGEIRPNHEPFAVAPLKNKLDLNDPTALNSLLVEEPVDYGAFWFFAFPKSFVETVGLPLPFFIKVDDIEFSLRIKKHFEGRIVPFPSIAVWHEPFYAKFAVWDAYYAFRNHLITNAINEPISFVDVVKHISKYICYTLLFFDYNYAAMLVKAFEDFVKGPGVFKETDPEQLHADILALSKSHKNRSIQQNYAPSVEKPTQIPKAGLLKKLASVLTLNGHFLPDFLINKDAAFVWISPGYPGQRSKAFARKKVQIFSEEAQCLFQYEMNQQAAMKILADWLAAVVKTSGKWSATQAEWRKASQELASTGFWQEYLQLKE